MIKQFSEILNSEVIAARQLGGGDISEVHWIKTNRKELVIKVNRDQQHPDLLSCEQAGLMAIAATRTISTPPIQSYQRKNNTEFLVMDYIPNRPTREGDHEQLAMNQLFGGFSPVFYHTYHEIFPLEPGHEARRDLYQLYYLLVHLNMFGSSYRDRVLSIMKSYFQ